MMRMLFTLLALGMFATAMVGCRASGEIGDTATPVVAPR